MLRIYIKRFMHRQFIHVGASMVRLHSLNRSISGGKWAFVINRIHTGPRKRLVKSLVTPLSMKWLSNPKHVLAARCTVRMALSLRKALMQGLLRKAWSGERLGVL